MTKRISIVFLLSTALLIYATTMNAEQTKDQIAIQEAESWLAIVDSEEYAHSWDNAATYFKNDVAKDQWIGSMNAYRKPLGKMIERKLNSNQYVTSLPGAPDGEYVVIQFSTVFENKKESIETITPMLDADGMWRVSGYFMK